MRVNSAWAMSRRACHMSTSAAVAATAASVVRTRGFGFGATLLRLLRGDLRAAQGRPGAVGLGARALLRQGDFELGAPQVRGGDGHRRFALFDTRLKVACIKLREDLVRFHGLVVGDVHGKDCAIDLGPQGTTCPAT